MAFLADLIELFLSEAFKDAVKALEADTKDIIKVIEGLHTAEAKTVREMMNKKISRRKEKGKESKFMSIFNNGGKMRR